MHRSLAIGVLCCSLLQLSTVRADSGSVMPRVRGYADHLYVSATPTSAAQLQALWSGRAIVVEPHDPALVRHKLAATRTELRALRRQGIAYTILDTSFQTVLDAAYDSWMHAPSGYSGAVPDWFARVQSLEAIFDYMDDLAQQSQGRASVKTLGKAFEQDIRVMRISSAPQDGERATILVTGAQHADEWLSPMVVTGLIWGLIATYDSDPEVKKVVDNLNVYVLPVMNPDSYARGNLARRTNQNPSCAGGVNLNRNWPSVGWGRGVQPCGGDNFAGEEALSEPETKAAKALADSLTRLVWYVDYHTPREAVMIPYAWTSMKPKMYNEAKQAAQSYASILGVRAQDGTVIGQGQGGGSLDYFQETLDESGGVSLCIEMTGSVDMRAPSTGIPDQVDKNLRAWLAVAGKLAKAHPAINGAAGAGGVVAAGSGGAASSATGGAGSVGMAGASSVTGGAGGTAIPVTGGAGGTATPVPGGSGSVGIAGVVSATGGAPGAVAGASGASRASTRASAVPIVGDVSGSAAAAANAPTEMGEAMPSGCSVTSPTHTSGWVQALALLLGLQWRRRHPRPTTRSMTPPTALSLAHDFSVSVPETKPDTAADGCACPVPKNV